MIITHIDIYTLNVPYAKPLKIAIGELDGAENVAIKITTDTGLVGWTNVSTIFSKGVTNRQLDEPGVLDAAAKLTVAAQSLHAVCPTTSTNFPTSQRAHGVAGSESSSNVPAAQSTHSTSCAVTDPPPEGGE